MQHKADLLFISVFRHKADLVSSASTVMTFLNVLSVSFLCVCVCVSVITLCSLVFVTEGSLFTLALCFCTVNIATLFFFFKFVALMCITDLFLFNLFHFYF